jgi:hypothetical protein
MTTCCFPNAITKNGDTRHGKRNRTVVAWVRSSEFCLIRKSALQDPNPGDSENLGFPPTLVHSSVLSGTAGKPKPQ